jgi:hypothetical protein
VLPVGGAELDAGLGDPARLIHATLDAPGDTLTVTATSSGAPLELLLLVPIQKPEAGYDAGELPRSDVKPASTAREPEEASDRRVIDEATAVEYRVIGSQLLSPRAGAPLAITVSRGSEPTRVALRVGAPTSFEAAEIERTPRALVRLRAWADTPAPSAKVDRTPAKTTSRPVVAIYGAGVALLGVLIATWWVWAGRRRSRVRGAERAAEERRS